VVACAEGVAEADAEGEGTEDGPLEWEKPRFEERKEERELMVQEQIAARGVGDKSTLAAMRHVPRHLFVPAHYAGRAYADYPLPIGQGQTISQPYIVALMTELLEVEPGDSILEIGTGSGYQAAVLTELTPYVYTIEIIDALGGQAAERLESLGYETVSVKIGDGYFGWAEHAPFDGIIVTCAAGHIPPPLLKQLKPGGRMVIPVGRVYEMQYLVRVMRDEEGKIRSQRLLPVRFVPMTGRAQTGE
jgi:protein-L-isoaspartate(D-aspartate) O-methyltransferase